MRRDDLRARGVELPVLPTVALGALPGAPDWAGRLISLGLDVVGSGAEQDTVETWMAAREASPFTPVKARTDDPEALLEKGCVIIESEAPVPGNGYRLGRDDAMVEVVDGASATIEDHNVIARPIVEATRLHSASGLWVVATPGLERLSREIVEAKLTALVEAAVQARLALAKDQFELE